MFEVVIQIHHVGKREFNKMSLEEHFFIIQPPVQPHVL